MVNGNMGEYFYGDEIFMSEHEFGSEAWWVDFVKASDRDCGERLFDDPEYDQPGVPGLATAAIMDEMVACSADVIMSYSRVERNHVIGRLAVAGVDPEAVHLAEACGDTVSMAVAVEAEVNKHAGRLGEHECRDVDVLDAVADLVDIGVGKLAPDVVPKYKRDVGDADVLSILNRFVLNTPLVERVCADTGYFGTMVFMHDSGQVSETIASSFAYHLSRMSGIGVVSASYLAEILSGAGIYREVFVRYASVIGHERFVCNENFLALSELVTAFRSDAIRWLPRGGAGCTPHHYVTRVRPEFIGWDGDTVVFDRYMRMCAAFVGCMAPQVFGCENIVNEQSCMRQRATCSLTNAMMTSPGCLAMLGLLACTSCGCLVVGEKRCAICIGERDERADVIVDEVLSSVGDNCRIHEVGFGEPYVDCF